MDKQRPRSVKYTSNTTMLFINGLLVLAGALGGMILILVFQQAILGLIWLVAGLGSAQLVLLILLRQRRAACQLAHVTTTMQQLVSSQAAALTDQQRQIKHLSTVLTADPGLTQLRSVLEDQTTPRLDLLVERLTQAESALPDMLPQTRAWVTDLRRLAIQAQAHIESLSDEVARRD